MIIISIAGTSRAADYSCKVSLLVNNNGQVKKGESITILVKVTDIQAGEGIAACDTRLEYNSDVFECTVNGEGEWGALGAGDGTFVFSRNLPEAISTDQTIAKIVLKAKTDAPIGKQTFKLTKMEFSTENEKFTVADVSTSITIADNTGSSDNNNNNNNNDNNNGSNGSGSSENGSTGNGSNGNGSTGNGSTGTETKNPSTINNPSSSNNVIPKTGLTDVLIVGAIIGTIVAVVFYIRYKKAY